MIMFICPKLVRARNKTMTKSTPTQKKESRSFVEAYGDAQRIATIFNWFIALLTAGLIAGMIIVLVFHDPIRTKILAIGTVSVLEPLYFIRLQKFELTATVLAILLISLITIIATKGLGVHHISILGYPAILIVASLVTRKGIMALIILYNILCVAWLVFGELSGAYTPTTLVHSVVVNFSSFTCILIVTAIMVRLISESLFRSSIQLQTELGERKLTEEKIRHQAARAEVLAALSKVLTQANQDYQLILDTVVRHSAELIGDGASIFLYSPDEEYLKLAAVYNQDTNAMQVFREELTARPLHASEGAYAQIIAKNEPILIPLISPEQLIERASPERREYYKKLPFYSMILAPLHAQGKILGMIGLARHAPNKNYTPDDLIFLQDIADRSALAMLSAQLYRELEQELAERKMAEEKYRNIFENAIDGIFQSTPEGQFINVNPAMARMYGYDSPEGMVQSIADISTQIYVDIHDRTELRRRLANGEKVTGFETLDYRKDRSTLWTSMNVQAVKNAAGNILYFEGTVEDITKRKENSEYLKGRQRFIETILDAEPGTVSIYDLQENKNVFINRNWLLNYGYSHEETQATENFLNEIIHSDDFPLIIAHHNRLKTAQDDKSIFDIEYRVRRKNGEWCWVQSRDTSFTRDPTGEVTPVLGILHDVTESKHSQNALIESEKKYRQLFENMTSGFAVHKMIYDEQGKPIDYRYLEINPAFERLTSVPVNILLGKTLKDTMPDTEEYWIEKFGHVASTGEPLAYTNFSPEFGKYYDTYAFSPERGTFAVIFNDVTEKVKAQEDVLKSQNRLQAFFNQSLDGSFFLMFDTPLEWNDSIDKEHALQHIFNTQRYTDVNNSMLEQYNITREQFLQSTSRDFFKHDPEQGLHLRRELFNNGHLHLETHERQTDGTPVWFEGDYACLYNDQKRITGFFGIQRDISERKKAEADIQKLTDELNERVQELEAKNTELTQFTYTVSHDLKSPLVTINGYLGYLEQDAASGNTERFHKDIQRIQEAANKMHQLLTELLELSRIGRLMNAPQAIQFEDIVQDAMNIVHGQFAAQHITVQIQPNLPIVHGDRQRLTEVLQNLLDNAAKYMGDQPDPRIEIGTFGKEHHKPVFFVKDNGIGIAPEYHERIFGLFNKLDARSDGTGIGLALVKRIIEVHGGRIWLESKLGKGSTFYFTLPISG